jgi:hypothetical protein
LRALVEDRGHEQWIRGLFDHHGVSARRVTFELPVAGGSGEQWVRENFPRVLQEHRTQKHQRDLWVLVVADADLQQRRRILEESIVKAGLEPISPSDRVVLLTPARNIETWAWCLLGNSVDETTDYKPNIIRSGAVLRIVAKQNWLPERSGEPASLHDGRAAWARLF